MKHTKSSATMFILTVTLGLAALFVILLLHFGLAAFFSMRDAPVTKNPYGTVSIEVDVWAGLSTPVDMRAARAAHEELHCLALNVYHEARGESWQGQVAVAEVTLVRAQARGGGVCREVYRPHQFSWTTDEMLRSSKPHGLPYVYAVQAAKTALLHEQVGTPPFSNGATHYHAKSVRPSWAREMVLVAEIGQHRFYRRA